MMAMNLGKFGLQLVVVLAVCCLRSLIHANQSDFSQIKLFFAHAGGANYRHEAQGEAGTRPQGYWPTIAELD